MGGERSIIYNIVLKVINLKKNDLFLIYIYIYINT